MQLVGTAFVISPEIIGFDHPEGFTGGLDNLGLALQPLPRQP
ncbi:MAG: hypothetical protein CM1200mP26_25230 [Acidimicrobiales bacterium]|nr:MAG: hypothetical protein CM1200mP26_25230 [Acidimicrobiales bacterium]